MYFVQYAHTAEGFIAACVDAVESGGMFFHADRYENERDI